MKDNLTQFAYSGQVNVKLKINGKLYEVKEHNEGLNYLMYIFAVWITGNMSNESFVPQYIDLRKVYEEEGEEIERSFFNYFSTK